MYHSKSSITRTITTKMSKNCDIVNFRFTTELLSTWVALLYFDETQNVNFFLINAHSHKLTHTAQND